MKETLSKVLTRKRMDENLSLVKAAKITGISRVLLWKMEAKGYTNISYETIDKLAKFLGITTKQVRELL